MTCRGVRGGVAAAALASAVAACGPAPAARVPADAALVEQCGEVPPAAGRVVVRSPDGVRLGAALVRTPAATSGLVVNYGRTQTLCDWLETAVRLGADARATILVLDRRGTGSGEGSADPGKEPDDVRAAVTRLQELIPGPVAVLGSSLGTDAAVRSALEPGPGRPCAVIAVSPAVGEAGRAAARAGVPPLWVATEIGNSAVLANAEQLVAAARAGAQPPRQDSRVEQVEVPGTAHGLRLIQEHPAVARMVVSAVEGCVGGS